MTPVDPSCVAEPISFLRLERFRLHELSAGEAHAVSEHLARCAACRACLASIEEDDAVLPERPSAPRSAAPRAARVADLIELRGAAERVRTRRWMALSSGAAGVLALAAAALLILRPRADTGLDGLRPARLGTKGGDVAVELVRNHRGALAGDPAVFADGDAFKVLVTCPPELAPYFDVVVYQADRAHFPLTAGRLTACGNRKALEGAFTLDGSDDAVVCVALDEQRPWPRGRLSEGPAALPELSVCTHVAAHEADR